MDTARFISAGRFTAPESWRHPLRTLPHDVLLLALHGSLHITEGGADYEMRFGDFVRLRADIPHWGCQDDPGVSYLTDTRQPGPSHFAQTHRG
jgi:quercetin dioxygenase-like cupin family protein